MNKKTYCPFGKIDCKHFGGYFSYDLTYPIRCLCNDGETHLVSRRYEVCPWPSRQQKIERYPIYKDQPAQITCHRNDCVFNNDCRCSNISPAIILYSEINTWGKFNDYDWVCRSFKEKP